MTIRTPQKNILDKILAVFGKERGIGLPENTDQLYNKYGPYVYTKARRESFWKVFLKGRENKSKSKRLKSLKSTRIIC